MLNATDSQKLLELWEKSDIHVNVVSSPAYDMRNGIVRALLAIRNELRGLAIIIKAGQK